MKHIRILIAMLIAALALPVETARAQSPYSAAYTVNSSVITNFDITQRMVLLEALGARGNLDALALKQLTDDRLKLQAARRNGVILQPGAMAQGLDEFAAARNMTGIQLAEQLRNFGVTQQAIDDFLVSGLLWREVIQGRFGARATPSDADIDSVLQISVSGQQKSVMISELGISFSQLGEDEARKLARRLSVELDGRGNFSAAVQKYSSAASAQNGGDLGWVPTSNLPPALVGQILSLMPGEVTAPIEVPDGLVIIKLRKIRTDSGGEKPNLTVSYGKLSIALARNAGSEAEDAARRRLARIRPQLVSCRNAVELADEFSAGSGRFGPVTVDDIPRSLASQLSRLDPGDSTIFRETSAMSLLLLCTRQVDVDPEQRQALRNRYFNQRINSFGQGYLQDLRRDAVIIKQ